MRVRSEHQVNRFRQTGVGVTWQWELPRGSEWRWSTVRDSPLPGIAASPLPPATGPGDGAASGRVTDESNSASLATPELLSRAVSHPILQLFPHGAIIVFDRDLRYLSAGGLGLTDVGLSPDMLVGRTIFDVFPGAVTELIALSYRAALAGTESAVEVPFGDRVYLQRLAPLRDTDGAIVAGMGFTQEITERRLLEKSHLQAEERLRQVIEHAPMGLAILRLDLAVVQVNPAFCRITGYRDDQLLAMNAAELAGPDGDLNTLPLARLLRGEIPVHTMDTRFRAADGSVQWAALSVSMLRAVDGSPAQYIVQVKDIGDRKRAEAALLDRTRRLRDAESVGHSGSWELDIATEQLTWSDGLFAVYGIGAESFGGDYDAASEIIHPDDRARVRAAVDACVRNGTPVELRYRLTPARRRCAAVVRGPRGADGRRRPTGAHRRLGGRHHRTPRIGRAAAAGDRELADGIGDRRSAGENSCRSIRRSVPPPGIRRSSCCS